MSFYETIDTLSDFSKVNLDKFSYVMGYCGENQIAEDFLSEAKMKPEFDSNVFYRFDNCQKLNSNPEDFILMKKNSKYNSLAKNEVLMLDDKKFDISRINNFFTEKKEIDPSLMSLIAN